MRVTAALAMALVGFECLSRALGLSPQNIFATDCLWGWYVPAFFWFFYAVKVLIRGID